MLRKILIRNQSVKQLIIALLGTLLGVLFLLISVHYLLKVNEFGKGSEMLGPNTLIIQKKVSNTTTLQLASTDFSKREIQSISKQPFIEEVLPVVSNNFGVEFATSDPMLPYFRSDVFIQAVNAKFLDVKSKQWNWNETDLVVPIILPRDFLVMLNTFMSSSGIPQISDELAKEVSFSLTLSNPSNKRLFKAKIIGFTNEVSSILVPETFMEYGNLTFGSNIPQKTTQLMLSGKEKEFGLVEKFLEKQHYESKNSQLVTGRLKSVVSSLLGVIVFISFLTLLFSSFVLIQYIQLLITRNVYEVRILLRLGYAPKVVCRVFVRYFVLLYLFICFISSVLFVLLKSNLDKQLHTSGVYIDLHFSSVSWATLGVSFVLFYVTTYYSTKRIVMKEF
jgi:ABC-type lipoprotein release transport system permease subunit